MWKKKVHFGYDDKCALTGEADIQKSLNVPISALEDDNTDFVPFEEYEPFRLARLKFHASTTTHESDTISAYKQSISYALSVDQVIPIDYDIPRKQPTFN